MNDLDKKQFAELMNATLGIYEKEVTKETLVMWWNALMPYSIEIVREALNRHITDKDNGRFAPRPAHILAWIDLLQPDGRPSADEAWALYPRSEADSAVINNEIAEAMATVHYLLDEGDKIGARMSFKDAYTRIVEQNKIQGIKPRWFASLGHNVEGREIALNEAVRVNRISQDYANSLLPAPKGGFVENLIGSMKLLEANPDFTEEQLEKNRKRIAEIKSMLKGQA